MNEQRKAFEAYRERQLEASSFIDDRQTSSLLDMANAILDADDAARPQPCPYEGLELWVMRTDQGQRVLVPLN